MHRAKRKRKKQGPLSIGGRGSFSARTFSERRGSLKITSHNRWNDLLLFFSCGIINSFCTPFYLYIAINSGPWECSLKTTTQNRRNDFLLFFSSDISMCTPITVYLVPGIAINCKPWECSLRTTQHHRNVFCFVFAHPFSYSSRSWECSLACSFIS